MAQLSPTTNSDGLPNILLGTFGDDIYSTQTYPSTSEIVRPPFPVNPTRARQAIITPEKGSPVTDVTPHIDLLELYHDRDGIIKVSFNSNCVSLVCGLTEQSPERKAIRIPRRWVLYLLERSINIILSREVIRYNWTHGQEEKRLCFFAY